MNVVSWKTCALSFFNPSLFLFPSVFDKLTPPSLAPSPHRSAPLPFSLFLILSCALSVEECR